jgi:F-type H+-transporting ATPase subunit c
MIKPFLPDSFNVSFVFFNSSPSPQLPSFLSKMMRRVIAQPLARRVAASTALVAAKPAASTVAISVQGLHYVGTGLAAIALAGVGLGIGTIFGNLLVACARQPNLTKMLFNYAILGFALTEAIGLFALMLAFLMLFS